MKHTMLTDFTDLLEMAGDTPLTAEMIISAVDVATKRSAARQHDIDRAQLLRAELRAEYADHMQDVMNQEWDAQWGSD